MKNLSLLIAAFVSFTLFAAPREISLKTEKIGEAVHWMPEKVEVTQGEKVTFVLHHDLEGGFDFHGFLIPELKISSQVNRHKETKVKASIPKDMKPGEYQIGCQFHPKHVPATLVVVAPGPKAAPAPN